METKAELRQRHDLKSPRHGQVETRMGLKNTSQFPLFRTIKELKDMLRSMAKKRWQEICRACIFRGSQIATKALAYHTWNSFIRKDSTKTIVKISEVYFPTWIACFLKQTKCNNCFDTSKDKRATTLMTSKALRRFRTQSKNQKSASVSTLKPQKPHGMHQPPGWVGGEALGAPFVT